MKNYILKLSSRRFLSKWIILLFDVAIIYFSIIVAIVIRANFEFPIDGFPVYWINSLWITAVYAFFFLIVKPYQGIIRHSGLFDAFKVFVASSFSIAILISSIIISRNLGLKLPIINSFSILIIHYLLGPTVLVASRVFVKYFYSKIAKTNYLENENIIIYGAGSSGVLTRNALLQDKKYNYHIISFIDDNHSKTKKTLLGIPIRSPKQVLQKTFIKKHKIDFLIIAMQHVNAEKRRVIIEKCLDLDLQVKIVPKANKWINETLSAQQIREVNIDELLERDPINLDSKNVAEEIHGKTVLITGAAGSIGSEITRQVILYHPEKVILVDNAETPMFNLQYEIEHSVILSIVANKVHYVIGDVKNQEKMNRIFCKYKPDVIYHAAAYKHVPLMENSPYEAITTNVFGSKFLADLAIKHRVKKFVFVSTDKAVNPTNIMGATKRIAEIYTQSLSNGKTQFVTTRFGNVLGSNGSVIPIFTKQIMEGGPVSITHKDITRYFMTIPEACNLVLEAGAMGNGGEIFVFDMGEPIKIYDLAEKMIKLSGYKPHTEIAIEISGLRPGEKLYEEVLNSEENTLPTHHSKITKAKVRQYTKKKVIQDLYELSELLNKANSDQLVSKMKDIIPEFISNNSDYEKLDKTPRKEMSDSGKR